ncbi:dipeptidase 1-like isoform X2 [Tubulanus polymorphus]|uniref:dipeptidase 1-like isoform X2 n=1 Tax=Tubulanus polymorphus TaxID=672921 RepID=UPI003DA375E8
MAYQNMDVHTVSKRKTYSKGLLLVAAVGTVLFALIVGLAVGIPLTKRSLTQSLTPLQRARQLLQQTPLIDGHNDLPYRYTIYADNSVETVNLRERPPNWNISHTDIDRLRRGQVGAQFWAAFVLCKTQQKDAVRATLEQIDVIKRYVALYPDVFEFVTSAQGILDAFKRKRIASLIGVEGGHSIDSSLGALRMMYDLGTRYMTLTHNCNTPWADNSIVDSGKQTAQFPKTGLNDFGKEVVREMNRIGMLVDISHVSEAVMMTVLNISEAPVIFSHSSSYALCAHSRNVKDTTLKFLAEKNKGVVMVNFFSNFINCPPAYNSTLANLTMVADHIDHIKNVAGADHVGIGADYDGVPWVPEGLDDVSKYPELFAELIMRGWSDDDLKKLAGENLLRVFKKAEEVRDRMSQMKPIDTVIPLESVANVSCRTRLPTP